MTNTENAPAAPTPAPVSAQRPVDSRPSHGGTLRPVTAPRSKLTMGTFGRMFRDLTPWIPPGQTDLERRANIQAIANLMISDANRVGATNPSIPAAYTYLGQFVDHDITFDPLSELQRQNDVNQLHNFRTPRFDLDSLYGLGPESTPFLYDRTAPFGQFLIGRGKATERDNLPDAQGGASADTDEHDLPRNAQALALIGDPRNDENIIVSQLHLTFLRLHNRFLDIAQTENWPTPRATFERAQTLLRWHYQWVVLHDFLPRIIGQSTHGQILPRGGAPTLAFFKWESEAFIPVEFSVAAYRFGHSMVREQYRLNTRIPPVPIFQPPSSHPLPLADLRGGRFLPTNWTIDWPHFFTQESLQIDTLLTSALAAIPAGPGGQNSLAFLNLLRGWRLELPSGQAVARAMSVTPLTQAELGLDPAVAGPEAPLWYYVLKEAEVQHGGQHLGAVGGRIVGEVLVGLALDDPHSFLHVDPTWTPEKAGAPGGGGRIVPGAPGSLTLLELLQFAGQPPVTAAISPALDA